MHAVTLPNDIIVAEHDQFDRILADIDDSLPLDVTEDGGVSIDDVVTIVAIHRDAIDDRQSWRKIRRDVYTRFASHADISSRTLAAIPDAVRNEVAGFDEKDIAFISGSWVTQDGATPMNADQASQSLRGFVNACLRARKESKTVFLRTTQPRNAFETAFSKLEDRQLESFRKSFSKWDAIKKYKAHERFNYYQKQGEKDCLNLVLRDFSRPKTTRLNLKTDQRKVQRHIVRRIKQYKRSPNPEIGNPADPITLIGLVFDIEYRGCAVLAFSTMSDVRDDLGCLEERADECVELSHWHEGLERLACDELSLKMTLLDGSKIVIAPDTDIDKYEIHIGEMLRETIIKARDSGQFEKLPLAETCHMWVGGTHADYSWPAADILSPEGRIK